MAGYASAFGLRGVWPESFPTFGAPAMILGDDAVDVLATFFDDGSSPSIPS